MQFGSRHSVLCKSVQVAWLCEAAGCRSEVSAFVLGNKLHPPLVAFLGSHRVGSVVVCEEVDGGVFVGFGGFTEGSEGGSGLVQEPFDDSSKWGEEVDKHYAAPDSPWKVQGGAEIIVEVTSGDCVGSAAQWYELQHYFVQLVTQSHRSAVSAQQHVLVDPVLQQCAYKAYDKAERQHWSVHETKQESLH